MGESIHRSDFPAWADISCIAGEERETASGRSLYTKAFLDELRKKEIRNRPRGKAFCVRTTGIHGHDKAAKMVERKNDYDALLPDTAAFTQIPGVKTVPLIVHCPRSRFFLGAQGCGELGAIRWCHGGSGDDLYIDGRGRIHHRS